MYSLIFKTRIFFFCNFFLFLFIINYQVFYVSSNKYSIVKNDQEKNKIGNEILCFSCFSVYSPRPYYAIKNHSKTVPKNSDDYIDIVNIVNETGLTIPNYVYSCADVSPFQASFQLLRANVRVCKVGSESEGICVKWKGNYKDKEFVYRECWDRMWVQPRPFVNNYKEFCIGSNLQKDFNTSITNNILCFCGKDLCNSSIKINCYLLFALLSYFMPYLMYY